MTSRITSVSVTKLGWQSEREAAPGSDDLGAGEPSGRDLRRRTDVARPGRTSGVVDRVRHARGAHCCRPARPGHRSRHQGDLAAADPHRQRRVSMALARLGAVQNPVLHLYREREVGAVLRQSKPDFFLVPGVWKDRDFGAMAKSLAAELETPPMVVELGDELPSGDPATLPPAPESGDDIRWVYYTSGTTSEPKGVQHSDQTLMAGGRGLAAALDMSSDDLGSIAFPYSHIGGPDYLLMMLSAGFGAVLIEAFLPADAVATYRDLGVTMCGGSTAFYQMFLGEQRKSPGDKVIPSLRIMSGGG